LIVRSDTQVALKPADAEDEPDTRRRILEAGIECVVRFGTVKTSMQDVADAAGLSRGTIYRYFADRPALLKAITTFETDRHIAAVELRAAGSQTFEEVIAIMVEESAARSRTL
jgi:AcrR family transcriptional regulator